MDGHGAGEDPNRGESERVKEGRAGGEAERHRAVGGAAEERLGALMEEFQRRQRERPDLVVRPWWVPCRHETGPEGGRPARRGAAGFVVEYCPGGVESAELAVRADRVRVEGPSGVKQARLDLGAGWLLDGEDRRCPETVANHLLSMADRLLEEAA